MKREELFKQMQAYKQTSLLRAGIELGVFDHLADGPADVDTVARGIGAAPRGARILLNALAAIRVIQSDGERYWIDADTADLLVTTRTTYAGGMIKVFAGDHEWDAMKDIAAAIEHGGTVLDQNAETPEYDFWKDFAANANVVAEPTAEVLAGQIQEWANARQEIKVLDMACGHGVYGYTVAKHFPQATIWSLDWENVLPVAKEHATRIGVVDRVNFIAGDMFEVPLGGPYDLVLITNVTHHFSEEKALELIKRGASALAPGGLLGIVGFTTSDKPPAQDPAPYLFDVLMLAWTTQGEVHSEAVYDRMLAAAGLRPLANEPVAGLAFHVLVAERVGE
jgi:C-methyltransferase